jgi:serine/threonine protein kinase
MASLVSGTLLADTYRVVRLVGVGGMGEVYEATHDRLAGRYAVKVLLAEIMSRVDVFQRFRREAEVTSSLRHPNIVQVLDFNVTADGHPFLVMEYLDGVELAAEIARVGAMPPGRVLDIVGQIASALTAARNHKIVHRDLKPQNLFLVRLPGEDREVVKVVDFGISKVREATTKLTQDSAVMGTPQYMAPEQAQGKLGEIDERTDEFALAAITYELFTGRPAFQGDSVPSILYQVVHEQPEPVSRVRPTLGPAVDAVVLKALSKSPRERYPSALDFHRELARAVAAERPAAADNRVPSKLPSTALDRSTTTLGLAAQSVELMPPRPGKGRRRWILAGLAATVALAGAALGVPRLRGSLFQPKSGAHGATTATAIPRRAEPEVTDIQFVHSTEKRDWLQSVTADFAKSHPQIRVDLVSSGSFHAAQGILDERLKPTMWSPADTMLLEVLESDWRSKHHEALYAATGDDAAQPLLLTPLVFIVWEDRANVLQKSPGGSITWKTIRQGVTSARGWSAIGGDARWGTVKLGHTDPTQSNSGLQTLILMLLEHTRKSRLTDHDLLNPQTREFILGIEKGVAKFESSTRAFTADMVRFGPSTYDIAVVYESCAIAELGNAEGRWGKLKVVYPPTTLWSDNPAVVLAAPWVTPAQREAAGQYLAFLRSQPAQQRALAFGFRPADTSVKIVSADPQNPFTRFADHGITVEVPSAAEMPPGSVARNLATMWKHMMQPGADMGETSVTPTP